MKIINWSQWGYSGYNWGKKLDIKLIFYFFRAMMKSSCCCTGSSTAAHYLITFQTPVHIFSLVKLNMLKLCFSVCYKSWFNIVHFFNTTFSTNFSSMVRTLNRLNELAFLFEIVLGTRKNLGYLILNRTSGRIRICMNWSLAFFKIKENNLKISNWNLNWGRGSELAWKY